MIGAEEFDEREKWANASTKTGSLPKDTKDISATFQTEVEIEVDNKEVEPSREKRKRNAMRKDFLYILRLKINLL